MIVVFLSKSIYKLGTFQEYQLDSCVHFITITVVTRFVRKVSVIDKSCIFSSLLFGWLRYMAVITSLLVYLNIYFTKEHSRLLVKLSELPVEKAIATFLIFYEFVIY
jgi:hypothetical protein